MFACGSFSSCSLDQFGAFRVFTLFTVSRTDKLPPPLHVTHSEVLQPVLPILNYQYSSHDTWLYDC